MTAKPSKTNQRNPPNPTQLRKATSQPMLYRVQLALLVWSGLMVFFQWCMV